MTQSRNRKPRPPWSRCKKLPVSEMSQVPDGWRLVRLGDVADVNPRRPMLDVEAGTPITFLPMAAIAENCSGILSREQREYREIAHGYTYFEENDVLFAKITPCLQNGKHAMATGLAGSFGFGTTEFHVIRAGSSIEPRHLFRVLTQQVNIGKCTKSFSGTAGQQRVHPEILRSFPIRLPPLPEQRAIAAVLDSIDEAIERTAEVIAATERLRDALLHELLTRGVPGWHTEWRDVPGLGTVPADWQVVQLADCIAEGPTNGIYKPESDYGSGTWLIRIDDFIAGALVRSDGFERIRVADDEAERYSIREGDILINRVNSLSHLGKSVLIPQLNEKALFESNMMKIKMCSELNSEFAMIVLLSHASRRYFIARAKKAVQQASINQQDVAQLPVPLPSNDEQELIAQVSIETSFRLQRARSVLASMVAAQASVAKGMLEGQIRINSSNRTAGDFEAALEQTRSTEAQSSTHDQV